MSSRIKAFTLVELIVVITILAVLGTIAYISLIGYSITARDTSRIADLNSIMKVIELYKVQEGTFPPVTNPVNVTFSGSTIWQQGSFGDETRRFTQRISEVPLDPLTQSEFAYSKTIATEEYQVGVIVEKDESVSYHPSLVSASYAVEVNPLPSFATTLIRGNYNGKFIVHREDNVIYTLGAPSILANIISSSTIQEIYASNAFIYEGESAFPSTYSGALTVQGDWIFNPTNITGASHIIFSGSLNTFNTGSGKLNFIDNLHTYYNGTEISNSEDFDELKNVDISNAPNTAIDIVNSYILGGIGGLGDDIYRITEVDTSGEESSGGSGATSTGVPCEFDTHNFDECDFS